MEKCDEWFEWWDCMFVLSSNKHIMEIHGTWRWCTLYIKLGEGQMLVEKRLSWEVSDQHIQKRKPWGFNQQRTGGDWPPGRTIKPHGSSWWRMVLSPLKIAKHGSRYWLRLKIMNSLLQIGGFPTTNCHLWVPHNQFCWQEFHWYWWYSLASYMIPPKGLGSIPSFIRNFSRFNIWVCLKIRQDIMVHHCFHSKFFLVFRSLGYLPLWTIPPIVGFLRYLSPKNNQMVGPIEWKIPILVPVDGSVTVLPQVSPKKKPVCCEGGRSPAQQKPWLLSKPPPRWMLGKLWPETEAPTKRWP